MQKRMLHPCYSIDTNTARIHLPVAPKCNLNCNYCQATNMLTSDTDKQFPGMTAGVLSVEDAVSHLREKMKFYPIGVVGISGPGDPLCNDETFILLERLREFGSGILRCICTNGILLADKIQTLVDLDIDSITITINSFQLTTIEKIYRSVLIDGKKYAGEEAAKIIMEKQEQALHALCLFQGMKKINIVYIQDVNSSEIEKMCEKIDQYGHFKINLIKLIPTGLFKNNKLHRPDYDKLCSILRKKYDFRDACMHCSSDACGFLHQ